MNNSEIKGILTNVYLTLNELDVKGEKNITYLAGVFNAIKNIIDNIDTTETQPSIEE